jgi:pyruvate dehydrogenase E1 component alpha subunit
MLRIRMVEEAIVDLYPEQEMRCPVHLCIGQEAVAAGVCATLCKEDYVLSNHRSHGHFLAKGGNLKKMLAEIYGKVTGCVGGKGGSMHLVDLEVSYLGSTPIVGGIIPVAVGVAFGSKMKKENRVTVVFLGDAAAEEGVFYESLNFAALKKLPVLFVCENNLYSVYSPLSVRQPKERDNLILAKAFGIEGERGDGNNVLEVSRIAGEAIARLRQGGGPGFVEFSTYRFREHCGPNYDNHIGYRTEEEFKQWERLCPISSFKKYLLKNKLIDVSDMIKIEGQIKQEIDAAIQFAKRSSLPPIEHLGTNVYAGGQL